MNLYFRKRNINTNQSPSAFQNPQTENSRFPGTFNVETTVYHSVSCNCAGEAEIFRSALQAGKRIQSETVARSILHTMFASRQLKRYHLWAMYSEITNSKFRFHSL